MGKEVRVTIKEQVIEMWQKGMTVQEICAATGRRYQQIRGYLVTAGLWKPQRRRKTKEEEGEE